MVSFPKRQPIPCFGEIINVIFYLDLILFGFVLILRSIKLNMLVRKLTSLAAVTTPCYAFGVDAKKLVIGVPKEVYQSETRVAITPEAIQRVIKKNGANFIIE